MRVDPMAAARSDMRARTRVQDTQAVRLTLGRAEIDALHAQQARVNLVMNACTLCCRRCWLEGNGSVLKCALLMGNTPMSPEEQELARQCPIPELYTEVRAGEYEDLKESDVLRLIPFEGSVPDGAVEHAELREAEGAWLAGQATDEQLAQLQAAGFIVDVPAAAKPEAAAEEEDQDGGVGYDFPIIAVSADQDAEEQAQTAAPGDETPEE